jgi:hypothetical protein
MPSKYKLLIVEKSVLFALKAWAKIHDLLDRDGDGDVDRDDLEAVYRNLLSILQDAPETWVKWASWSTGQRIDAVVKLLRQTFPTVSESLWVLLEGLAYLGLKARGLAK